MLITLFLAIVAAAATPSPVHDGGVCTGIGWVTLQPGETVTATRGLDSQVLYFHGLGGVDWGIYVGFFAPVHAVGPAVFKVNGVTVRRGQNEKAVASGFLAEKDGSQNHVFSSDFNGTDADLVLMKRVDFSAAGQTLCAKGH